MGKETRLNIPALPTTVIHRFGGYHVVNITSNNHGLFEQIPSLGIAGDMIMAVASNEYEPIPNIRVVKPKGTEFTTNLVGKIMPIGPRRPEIGQRLAVYGITSTPFHENVRSTKFNLKYVKSLSDIIGRFETYI
ncbi:hypothetical protein WA026_019329 [Henosepilachna vigintioctopunctata]|uniref:Uncharacterized protein n=1 Tax=Henosepilachna vigintioctopunctata TaxID=420089 RepID=A0AAW1UAL7_9CUCU